MDDTVGVRVQHPMFPVALIRTTSGSHNRVDAPIVACSLGVGFLVVVAWASWIDLSPSMPVGPPNWDFTKSWGTNITVLGAVFVTFFSNKIVPAPHYVQDPGYPTLSVLFAVLALVAPIFFMALSDGKQVRKDSSWEVQYQGKAFGFLVAMFLTLSAALGQLTTLAALTAEVLRTGTLRAVTLALLVVLIGAVVAIVVYAWRTAGPLVRHQKAVQDKAAQRMDDMTANLAAGAVISEDTDPTRAPLPVWSLL